MALQVWLPLNGDLKNNGLYDLPSPNMTNLGTLTEIGKIGQCYTGTTSTYFYYENIDCISTTEWSVAAWLKPVSDSSSGHQYFVSICTNANDASHFLFSLCWCTNRFGIRIGGTTYIATAGKGLDAWTHVCATYNNSVLKIYIDGVLEKTQNNPVASVESSILRIQGRFSNTANAPGGINDIRIYDHALSPKEVKEISKGLVLHYPLDNNEDAGEGNIVYDCSGYGHHGMWYGNKSTATDTARYSKCTYLDNGQTTYIQSNSGCGNPSDAITMNIWFKSSNTNPGSGYHHMFNGLTTWTYIEMAVYKDGYLRCGLYIGGTRYVANCGSGLLDGNWHMLTMTYDGANVKRYVDGVLLSTQAATGTIDRSNDPFIFGHGASTGYYCKEAYLSDARIYATALSATDILELYKTAAVVDNQQNLYAYEFVEDDDAQVYSAGVVKADFLTEAIKIQIHKDGHIKSNSLYEF